MRADPLKFLYLIASADGSGGGPIEGALRLHEALVALGHSGKFVTCDASYAPFVGSFPAPIEALGPASAGTYGYSPRLLPWLKEHAHEFDAVIVNGLWQYVGFAAHRALARSPTPYFVFTHGMLDPWFRQRYPIKHLKKWLYWPWAEYRVLRDATAVLFTCEEERLLARQSFWLYRCREVVVSYGTSPPPHDEARLSAGFLACFPVLEGKRPLLFLGRIHEKKGCDLLLRAFAARCSNRPEFHLVMAGPDHGRWTDELKRLAKDLGISDRVLWPGMLGGDLKWGAFYSADAFCLPSHQENFGIAVAEALACGRPVLISNKVNIWREIETDGAGYVEADTIEGATRLLERWLETSNTDQADIRAAAKTCFERRFRIERVARNIVELVQSFIPSTPKTVAKTVAPRIDLRT